MVVCVWTQFSSESPQQTTWTLQHPAHLTRAHLTSALPGHVTPNLTPPKSSCNSGHKYKVSTRSLPNFSDCCPRRPWLARFWVWPLQAVRKRKTVQQWRLGFLSLLLNWRESVQPTGVMSQLLHPGECEKASLQFIVTVCCTFKYIFCFDVFVGLFNKLTIFAFWKFFFTLKNSLW